MLIALQEQVLDARIVFAFVLYSIGVIALFWVFRRSIRKTRQRDKSDVQCFKARGAAAHQEIDLITNRVWLEKYRAAIIFSRDHPLMSSHQRSFLARISQRQRRQEDV